MFPDISKASKNAVNCCTCNRMKPIWFDWFALTIQTNYDNQVILEKRCCENCLEVNINRVNVINNFSLSFFLGITT